MLTNESIYAPVSEPVKINFDAFYNNSIAKHEEDMANQQYVNISITGVDSILDMDLKTMDDRELFSIIQSSYPHMLHMIIYAGDERYLNLTTQDKFLVTLNQVLSQERQIEVNNIYHLNKLIYDYTTVADHDKHTMNLFMTLARTINRPTISRLMGLGLDEATCVDLAVCRYSTSDDVICTKRLNNKIIQGSHKVMTEQMIVDIYSVLYTSATPLFIGIMYDIYSQNDLEAISEDASIINSTINLALLDMIEVMPWQDIRKVLISYATTFGLNPNFSAVRFNVALCPDYPRIAEVAKYLQTQESIVMP